MKRLILLATAAMAIATGAQAQERQAEHQRHRRQGRMNAPALQVSHHRAEGDREQERQHDGQGDLARRLKSGKQQDHENADEGNQYRTGDCPTLRSIALARSRTGIGRGPGTVHRVSGLCRQGARNRAMMTPLDAKSALDTAVHRANHSIA